MSENTKWSIEVRVGMFFRCYIPDNLTTPNEDTPERLMHSLESGGVKDFLDHITNVLDDPQVPVEVSVANLHRKLLENQKVPFPQKFYLRKKEKGNLNLYLGSSPWFDESCRLAKTKLNKSRKQYKTAMKYLSRWGSSFLKELRDNYFSDKKLYKSTLRFTRRNYFEGEKEQLWNLRASSPKEFWKTLGTKNKSNIIIKK